MKSERTFLVDHDDFAELFGLCTRNSVDFINVDETVGDNLVECIVNAEMAAWRSLINSGLITEILY